MAIDVGENVDVATIDGVTINVDCEDDGGGDVGMSIDITSASDGWYMPWEDSQVLDAATTVNWTSEVTFGGQESADERIDGFAVRTPNGWYMAIDGETAMWILNSASIAADCVYIGMLQWYPPGG